MNDVSSIPDVELLKRAIKMARKKGAWRQPRWVHVMHVFQLGSTFAAQLCHRFGLDPEERVSP